MKEYALIIILSFFSLSIFSQESDNDSINKNLTIIKDSRIDKLNDTYKSSYKLEGYRIQIYSGNKKQPARQARQIFTQVYKKTKAHESYEQPYFKVRVGDFRTKLEALKFKNELVKHFPDCFIIKDEIEIENI